MAKAKQADLHSNALSLCVDMQRTKSEQKAYTSHKGRQRKAKEKLHGLFAQMQKTFESGGTVGACTSMKEWCKTYRSHGALTYARVRQILTGKSGNEGKVKLLYRVGEMIRDTQDNRYVVTEVSFHDDDEKSSFIIRVEPLSEKIEEAKQPKPAKKSAAAKVKAPVIHAIYESRSGSMEFTCCGKDVDKVKTAGLDTDDVPILEGITCKLCLRRNARQTSLDYSQPEAVQPLTHNVRRNGNALCNGRKLEFNEVAYGGASPNPTCPDCKRINAKRREKYERETKEVEKYFAEHPEIFEDEQCDPETVLVINAKKEEGA